MEQPASDLLDFTEALKDSPQFRQCLSQQESSLTLLENKLKEVFKQCQHVAEHGKTYVNSFNAMLEALSDLNLTCFKDDNVVFTSIITLGGLLSEVAALQKILVEQANWSISKNLNDFMKKELRKSQETRVHFSRLSQSLQEALVKNAQISKYKEQERYEARNELTAVGTCFAHTTLDYVYQINILQSRKRHEILEALVGYYRACKSYFMQGFQLICKDSASTNIDFDLVLTNLKQQSKQIDRKMQDRHTLVPREIFQHPTGMSLDPDVVMEGYLFKRASNAFKSWNRRWFVIRDNKLLYRHRANDNNNERNEMTADGYTIMEADLRLCLVRQASNNVERRHCFELVTPSKIHMLQADSETLCDSWMKALQRSIESALHDSSLVEPDDGGYFKRNNGVNSATLTPQDSSPINEWSPATTSRSLLGSGGGAVLNDGSTTNVTAKPAVGTPPKRRRVLDEILNVPGNDQCADCGDPNPRWASVNLGVTLCIECCASHRGMGVQVSKVRSLTLDAWEPEQVKVMAALGNTAVNAAYLSGLSEMSVPAPIKPSSLRAARDAWIRAKYLERQFVLRQREPKDSEKKRRRIRVATKPTVDVGKKPRLRAMSAATSADTWKLRKAFGSSPSLNIDHSNVIEEEESSLTVFGGDEQTSLYGSDSALANVSQGSSEIQQDQSWKREQGRLLLEACHSGDLNAMADALARGADVNFADQNDADGLTPLHQTVISGVVEASEYLLLNSAKINIQDGHGLTPLHLACKLARTAHVCLLLKRGASQDLSTLAGETALDLSMVEANADIVTLLRLAKLNEEIKETEYGNGGDETFAEVVRDISMMASNRPELLERPIGGDTS